ncbi:MAG: winged helix DNA-binding domain-containing protein [Actinobacteria bacterium]|nr:winged helix DNA-binding domain-containing protein [Actinomycetota bacterium]
MGAVSRVRSLAQAAAFVRRVGIATVFPTEDLVLPSLWEAVAGPGVLRWDVRDEEGRFVSFTPEMDRVWRFKDELPDRLLACAGRHVTRVVTLVAPELAGHLYAFTGRPGRADDFQEVPDLTPLQREVAEAVLEHGPAGGPGLRRLLGTDDRRRVDRAVWSLQRMLVLTNAGVEEQRAGWPALRFDLFARRWGDRLARLPTEDEARRDLALAVLRGAGDATAPDVAAALGWRKRDAGAVLEELADAGRASAFHEDGVPVWKPLGTRTRRRP